MTGNRVNVVGITTKLRAVRSEFRIPVGARYFYLLLNAQTNCGTTQPPVQWVLWFFPSGKSGRDVKLTIRFHIVSTVRMSGVVAHLPLFAFMA